MKKVHIDPLSSSLATTAKSNAVITEPPETIATFPNQALTEIFEGGKNWNPLAEVERIFAALSPPTSLDFIKKIHNDLTAIFTGEYPGFKGGPTKYHDLRHTRNVVLATIRLFHGLSCQGTRLRPEILQLGLASAYFHDTGMLLTNDDTAETGAAYLKNHEERSICFLQRYLAGNGFLPEHIGDCTAIINCTNLMVDPTTLSFPSTEIRIAGHVVGTADIMAQMADRYYLECLPLLYLEQRAAGIHRYNSALELMRQTTKFYHEVTEQRLKLAFNNTTSAMQTHFREWWQIDRNLYMEFITKNIAYLELVIADCDAEIACIDNHLRRKRPKMPI